MHLNKVQNGNHKSKDGQQEVSNKPENLGKTKTFGEMNIFWARVNNLLQVENQFLEKKGTFDSKSPRETWPEEVMGSGSDCRIRSMKSPWLVDSCVFPSLNDWGRNNLTNTSWKAQTLMLIIRDFKSFEKTKIWENLPGHFELWVYIFHYFKVELKQNTIF